MVLYGEEEEEMMQKSTDPVIKRIWDEKIVEEYAPTPKVQLIYFPCRYTLKIFADRKDICR